MGSRSGSNAGPVDGAQLVEAVGEGAARQCAEDGCLGLVGEPDEVLSGVVGDQALPGPFRPGGPQRLVTDGRAVDLSPCHLVGGPAQADTSVSALDGRDE